MVDDDVRRLRKLIKEGEKKVIKERSNDEFIARAFYVDGKEVEPCRDTVEQDEEATEQCESYDEDNEDYPTVGRNGPYRRKARNDLVDRSIQSETYSSYRRIPLFNPFRSIRKMFLLMLIIFILWLFLGSITASFSKDNVSIAFGSAVDKEIESVDNNIYNQSLESMTSFMHKIIPGAGAAIILLAVFGGVAIMIYTIVCATRNRLF